MTSGTKSGTRARMASIASPWSLIVMLILAGLVASAPSVDAASVTLSWTAPTTNADGTALTDLSGYRIYLATSTPGLSERVVLHGVIADDEPQRVGRPSRPVSQPSPQVPRTSCASPLSIARVTRAHAPARRAVSPSPDFSVTPSTTTNFGSVATGSTADRTFTVQNTGCAQHLRDGEHRRPL